MYWRRHQLLLCFIVADKLCFRNKFAVQGARRADQRDGKPNPGCQDDTPSWGSWACSSVSWKAAASPWLLRLRWHQQHYPIKASREYPVSAAPSTSAPRRPGAGKLVEWVQERVQGSGKPLPPGKGEAQLGSGLPSPERLWLQQSSILRTFVEFKADFDKKDEK